MYSLLQGNNKNAENWREKTFEKYIGGKSAVTKRRNRGLVCRKPVKTKVRSSAVILNGWNAAIMNTTAQYVMHAIGWGWRRLHGQRWPRLSLLESGSTSMVTDSRTNRELRWLLGWRFRAWGTYVLVSFSLVMRNALPLGCSKSRRSSSCVGACWIRRINRRRRYPLLPCPPFVPTRWQTDVFYLLMFKCTTLYGVLCLLLSDCPSKGKIQIIY